MRSSHSFDTRPRRRLLDKMFPWRGPSKGWIVVGLAVGLALSGISRAQEPQLENENVSAKFGSRGLISISETAGGVPFEFNKDAWSLEIDQDQLSSDEAGEPRIKREEAGAVSYTFEQKGYTIEVLYSIEPGWHFVSKQLKVLKTPNPQFTVHSVETLSLGLAQDPESTWVPTTYLPHFLTPPEETRKLIGTQDFGAFLRYPDQRGLALVVQNPFLSVKREPKHILLGYKPDMEWKNSWGNFASDIACLGPYRLSGRQVPAQMVREWQLDSPSAVSGGADRAEIATFSGMVHAFLLHASPKPISVEVAWTLNDYQIDIGTPEGLAEYKRLIDSTSELGIQTLVYTGSNSKVSDRNDNTDAWQVEHLLWLNLGKEIRAGKWDPANGVMPTAMTELIDYAKSKHVGILAYVYPSLPFAQDRTWIHVNTWPPYRDFPAASLGSHAFQDFLIKGLIDFLHRTGIAGYSFDYTFLCLEGSSTYSQWWGWRRVMESLRKAVPDIVIDGRQTYQSYGPWTWLAGSYPHPSGSDEQPESFVPYPDLHFDRVSADRMRFVNYWYRDYQFAPEEVLPGYMTHQTERSRSIFPDSGAGGHPEKSEMVWTRYRPRDWDYLGYKYGVISSVASAGWNNVMNFIPSRDPEEAKYFRAEDKAWIREWLQWTVTNEDYLRHTRTILGQPAIGKVDGTSAIIQDHGFVFLFNPNYESLPARFQLDDNIGLAKVARFVLKELYPQKGRLIGKPGAGVWAYGDEVELPLDGTVATALEIVPEVTDSQPLVFNAGNATQAASAHLNHGQLEVSGAVGEPGTEQEIGVLLRDVEQVSKMTINGRAVHFRQNGAYVGAHVRFAGKRFAQAEQVTLAPNNDGNLTGTFVVPARVLGQLAMRKKTWPIAWTKEDYKTPWLVPERLLLFVQTAEPKDSEEFHVTLDGKALPLTPAYSSVRVHPASYVGSYADLTNIKPDVTHTLSIEVPASAKARFQGVFFDNVEPQWTDIIEP